MRAYPIHGERAQWAYLFEDQAEWRWLAHQGVADESDLAEREWNGLVYRNLRLQSEYRFGEQVSFFSYRTRSGVFVPFVLSTAQGVLGVIPISGTDVPHKALMGAHSFLKKYAKSTVLFVSKTAQAGVLLDDRIGLVPASLALFE